MGQSHYFRVPIAKQLALTDEEIQMLLSHPKKKDVFVLKILIYTGLRNSEFLHLKKDWINFEKRVIKIPSSQTCECSECARKRHGIWKPKYEQSVRSIPILNEILPDLMEYFIEHENIMETYRNRVYTWSVVKKMMKIFNIKRRIKNMKKEVKIKNPYTHALRATFASILAKHGYNALVIQKVLGWNDINLAQTYVNMHSEDAANIILKSGI